MKEHPIRFDDAFERSREWLRNNASALGGRVLLLRDLVGRMALLIDGPRVESHQALSENLAGRLGAYGADESAIFLYPQDFFDHEALFKSPDTRRLFPAQLGDDGPQNVWLLERELTGLDWMRAPLPKPKDGPEPPRVTFFGLKGGVGRTTALVLFARALAKAGVRVLVVDLDLESPGLGSLLLPDNRRPKYGIVDYLVEQSGGGVDEQLVDDIIVRSPLVEHPTGEIHVIPAGGTRGDYLAKLGRVYQPVVTNGSAIELAERIDAMIAHFASKSNAQVVLLDSRAGLHDLAAFTVTRLRAHALLFGVGTSQTWNGYELLFKDWMRHPSLDELRDRLHMVAALIPETGRKEYTGRFVGKSYDLFADTLYEEVNQKEPSEGDAFNFDVSDETAPHYPIPIYWNRALQEFDPIQDPNRIAEDQLRIATNEFCSVVGKLIGMSTEPSS